MKIGNIDLGERPVVLAPMEDVTDASFRILCREAGASMVTTEFVPSDGLVRDASKAIAKMRTLEEEAPVAIQIYGHIPESMVDAARMADRAAELAGGHGADTIDINWGCPVSKIAGRGARKPSWTPSRRRLRLRPAWAGTIAPRLSWTSPRGCRT